MRRAELRDLVVRGFAVAGLLVGLWWGINVEPASHAPLNTSESGWRADALIAALMPVLGRAMACALGGALVGAVVALTAPGLRRPR